MTLAQAPSSASLAPGCPFLNLSPSAAMLSRRDSAVVDGTKEVMTDYRRSGRNVTKPFPCSSTMLYTFQDNAYLTM
jgi:hypothetical protein